MQYNQSPHSQSVRVGNWFEEIKLLQETGIRFYPDPTDKATNLLTKARCIIHTEQTDPKTYVSLTHSTITDPKKNPNYIKVETKGPRQKRFEAEVKNTIDQDMTFRATTAFNESRKLAYTTQNKDTYVKTGFVPSLKENDYTLRLPTHNSNYSTDAPVTIYTHAVTDPKQRVTFPVTFVGSMVNPFRKNCVFSADIEHDVIMTRTETYERPNPLPTVQEYKHLLTVRQKCLMQAKKVIQSHTSSVKPLFGQAVYYLILLLNKIPIERDMIPLSELKDLLSENLQVEMTALEERALLSAYDKMSNGCIVVDEFRYLLKRTPSPRRMELIGIFYRALDPIQEGRVSLESAESMISGANGRSASANAQYFLEFMNNLSSVSSSGGSASPSGLGEKSFTVDEFYDFYVYVSSELEENNPEKDDQFEMVLKSTWGAIPY